MENFEKKYTDATECPITTFIDKIGGKWKPVIIWLLFENCTMRFSELDKAIDGITQKMLTQQLKDLEVTKLINRLSYPVIPPKVEYSLTDKGVTLYELLKNIKGWSIENLN